jgi:hypothetical protein
MKNYFIASIIDDVPTYRSYTGDVQAAGYAR